MTSHEQTADHIAAAKIHTTIAMQRQVSNLVDYTMATLTGTKKAELHEKLLQLRSLTHALSVSYGIAPHNVGNLISPAGDVFASVQLLARHHVPSVGIRQTVDADLPKAYELTLGAARDLVKGTQGSIVTDGGSLKDSKGVVVLYVSRSLPHPLLLSVCMPEILDDTGNVVVYDADACSNDVKSVCALIGIDLATMVRLGREAQLSALVTWAVLTCVSFPPFALQVTNAMGDNVTFNDNLADALGVMRGKCLSHAENLVAEDGLAPFFDFGFDDLVVKAGGLITAGGTNKRKTELEGQIYKLSAGKMLVYDNRFASAIKVNRYRLLNFETVKLWHTEGATLNLKPSNDEEAVKDTMQKSKSAAAYKDKHAKLLMQIVDSMYGDLPETITHLSGNGDSVDPAIVDRLLKERKLYNGRAADPTKTITAACAAVNIVAPQQVTVATIKYKDVVMKSAKAAAVKWDKHIPEMIAHLRRRMFYTPSQMPPLPPAGGLATFVEYWSVPGFDDKSGLSAGELCHMYLIPEARPNSFDYWRVRQTRWAKLYKQASFWIEFESSSIEAERVIAIVRKMNLPGRGSMSNDTFRREIFLRVNRFIVEALLEQKRKEVVEFK